LDPTPAHLRFSQAEKFYFYVPGEIGNMGYSLGIWYENERKGRKMRTEKAQKILDAIERRDRKAVKRWKPDILSDARRRERVLDQLNASTMDDVGPVGGQEQGMKVLSDMNDLDQQFEKHIESRRPHATPP
jgi:hypothetical protein